MPMIKAWFSPNDLDFLASKAERPALMHTVRNATVKTADSIKNNLERDMLFFYEKLGGSFRRFRTNNLISGEFSENVLYDVIALLSRIIRFQRGNRR